MDHTGKTCFERLVHCLKARRERGLHLCELDVLDCHHVYEADIEELEGIVEIVEWDQEENFTDEEENEDRSDDYDDYRITFSDLEA